MFNDNNQPETFKTINFLFLDLPCDTIFHHFPPYSKLHRGTYCTKNSHPLVRKQRKHKKTTSISWISHTCCITFRSFEGAILEGLRVAVLLLGISVTIFPSFSPVTSDQTPMSSQIQILIRPWQDPSLPNVTQPRQITAKTLLETEMSYRSTLTLTPIVD